MAKIAFDIHALVNGEEAHFVLRAVGLLDVTGMLAVCLPNADAVVIEAPEDYDPTNPATPVSASAQNWRWQ